MPQKSTLFNLWILYLNPLIALCIFRAKEKGAKLIVADPRNINPSRFADVAVTHRLGSDVALLNGMMHVIIKNGWQIPVPAPGGTSHTGLGPLTDPGFSKPEQDHGHRRALESNCKIFKFKIFQVK